ncbi:putative DNA binding domain-containing protein [Kineosporia rhizophila]|uniref:RNA-binding domain-containing protein n=1 Tax=Kineosporia rhizophila TaxID=84633 RepID=UPI001E2EA48F|nr:putative DNA binding domain-containing protein [Kineosporia rhizophila]GLY15715.1 transcriptional regulator [Kineosporia sp. NBRC 101677]
MHVEELASLVSDLRQEGSDTPEVEVKRAAGGFPDSVLPTVSAFANTPGGGTIVFGLDERSGFAAVGVYDAAACKATLATKARQALDPPVTFEAWDLTFEGVAVLVVKIHEQPAHGKPCRVLSSGKAYLRSYDGDYELSQVEEQAFVANRSTPVFDQQPVPGTTTADLRADLLASYLTSCRASSTALGAMSDEQILYRTGVTTGTDRVLSLAGLLALGTYPQQHVPNCVIQASVAPRSSDPAGTRAADVRRFDGPLPLMLDEALRWVQRNTRTRVRFGIDGQARDEPEFPVEAVRELLSNALIHRDVGPYALTQAITLRLDERQLILSNPGGLWGITVDRLGKSGVTSARNGHLLRICQNVRSQEGNRVVEALASGIPAVLESLRNAGMVPPRFHDQGISFTVAVPNHALLAADDLTWLAALPAAASLSDRQRHALVAMRHGQTWTNQTFRETFPMDSREARTELAGLVEAGVATAEGERGQRIYRLPDALTGQQDAGSRTTSPLTSSTHEPHVAPRTQPQPTIVNNTGAGRRIHWETIKRQLQTGEKSASELVIATGLTARQVQYALQQMREAGLVVLVGSQGRRESRYRAIP